MFKIIAIAVVVVIAALLMFAATRPDSFRIERSPGIKASPEKVFAFINDFRQWTPWSPWEKIDPDLKRSYSGAASGKGTVYAWEGNNKVGMGRMEIMDSTPPAKIIIKLDFLKPFEAPNTAEFTLEAKGDTTNVTLGHVWPQSLYLESDGNVFQRENRERE
ncbi:MAG: SRPBCC family protein [Chromatiales bacterium]